MSTEPSPKSDIELEWAAAEAGRQFELWKHYDDRIVNTLQLFASAIVAAAIVSGLLLDTDDPSRNAYEVLAGAGFAVAVAGVLALNRLVGAEARKVQCTNTLDELHKFALGDSGLTSIVGVAAPRPVGRYGGLVAGISAVSATLIGVSAGYVWNVAVSPGAVSWVLSLSVALAVFVAIWSYFRRRRARLAYRFAG